MTNIKFYRCPVCGNIVMKVMDSGVPVVCCGQPMVELVANASDGAGEKHVPVVALLGQNVGVSVGTVPHPMAPEHYIQWIYLETSTGGQMRYLQPGQEPEANFKLEKGIIPLCVYAYCNLHSLWKREIDIERDTQTIQQKAFSPFDNQQIAISNLCALRANNYLVVWHQ